MRDAEKLVVLDVRLLGGQVNLVVGVTTCNKEDKNEGGWCHVARPDVAFKIQACRQLIALQRMWGSVNAEATGCGKRVDMRKFWEGVIHQQRPSSCQLSKFARRKTRHHDW